MGSSLSLKAGRGVTLHNPNLEAAHWAETGQINVARTQWVLHGMRPLPRAQRIRLADDVAQLMWVAPVAAP